MAEHDYFADIRHKKRERQIEKRAVQPHSFLIVTEGSKTEPLYFNGLVRYIQKRNGGALNVVEPLLRIEGQGQATVSLVKAAEKIVNRSVVLYENVWLVFDKDDFSDFDLAIAMAEANGFKVAWSNQAFEYWLYLHFRYSDVPAHRKSWLNRLSVVFRNKGYAGGYYRKNLENIFDLCSRNRGLQVAVNNARRVRGEYPTGSKPSLCNPCTTVYELILELSPYLRELL